MPELRAARLPSHLPPDSADPPRSRLAGQRSGSVWARQHLRSLRVIDGSAGGRRGHVPRLGVTAREAVNEDGHRVILASLD